MVRSFSICCVLICAGTVVADWPQWRGPNRDGVAKAFPSTWPKTLNNAWKLEVGEGHSGPVVVGERVYLHSREGENEVTRCMNLSDGREIWKKSYAAPVEVDGAAAPHGKGPKATPCLRDSRLYTFGLSGILTCYSADKGQELWQKKFEKFPKKWPLYGASTSPIIVNNLCIIWAGGHDQGALVAFEAKSGAQKWSLPLDGPGYTSPIVAPVNGKPQLITQSQKFLLGVDPTTGRELWKKPFTTGYDQNSVTPVMVNDLLIYSGYQKALYAGKFTKAGKLEEAWEVRQHPLYMSSPVVVGDKLFGVSMNAGSTLFAANLSDGEILWKKERVDGHEYGALIRAGEKLLFQNTAGKISIFSATAKEYQPEVEYEVSDSPTWAHPALTADYLFTKDKTHLHAWKLK